MVGEESALPSPCGSRTRADDTELRGPVMGVRVGGILTGGKGPDSVENTRFRVVEVCCLRSRPPEAEPEMGNSSECALGSRGAEKAESGRGRRLREDVASATHQLPLVPQQPLECELYPNLFGLALSSLSFASGETVAIISPDVPT